MGLLDLAIRYTFQTVYSDPLNSGLPVSVWSSLTRAYNDDTKSVDESTSTTYVRSGEADPEDFTRPTNQLLDSYPVPTATTAPGYVAGKEGQQASVYHDGTGGLTLTFVAPCDLAIASLSSSPTTAAGTATGSVSVQLTGSRAGKQVRLTNGSTFQTAFFPVNTQGEYTFAAVPAGAYTLQASDDNPDTPCAAQQAVEVAEFARIGCRDPAASNYDPLASEDGACAYAPVETAAIFSFPEAQALRLVVPPLGGLDTADRRTLDNTLLSDQRQPGHVQPAYCQKVCRRDEVQVQFKSTFTRHLVQLCRCGTGAVVRTYPARRIVRGQGNVATFGVYLTAHTTAAQARLYFQAAVLPLPLLPGNQLELSGLGIAALEGAYPIVEVREDTLAGVPYLVLNIPYGTATALARLDGQATTTFDVAAFDVWQVALNLTTVAAGCYFLRVTATDPALGSAQAVSEPLEVATEHPGTQLITYRNFDNAHGLNYSHGLVNRLRVASTLSVLDTDTQKEVLLESGGRTTLLSGLARRQRRLKTFLLPGYLHEKIALAFAHDLVLVQGEEWVSEAKYDYPPLQERYGLTNGSTVLTRRESLGAGNGDDLGDLNQGQGFLIANEGYLRY